MSGRPGIALLDYGMGNLRSVAKAFESRDAAIEVVSDPDQLERFVGCILPGVGAFPRAMERIASTGLDEAIARHVLSGRPILGICLGLQLLFDSSDELGGAEGLGLIPGPVRVLDSEGLKLPHIGWAAVQWESETPLAKGIESGEAFYFVHSHVAQPDPADIVGVTEYGTEFTCAVARDNVFGVQFHPEKSSEAGLRLVSNFVSLCDRGEV